MIEYAKIMYWTKNENWDILCTDEKDIRVINIFYGKGEMPVQIMDVRVLRANRAVYCKIFTDEGIDVIPAWRKHSSSVRTRL